MKNKLDKLFIKILQLGEIPLKNFLQRKLSSMGYNCSNEDGFLYAQGNMPVLLLAHLDTVHKSLCTDVCVSTTGVIMSPQGVGGDDRCGVYIILRILSSFLQSGQMPSILFTEKEEVGCVGAKKFAAAKANYPETDSIKFLVEFDRKDNNDCCFYSCNNPEFETHVEKFGFKTTWGSCSDISYVAPALKKAAVNLSSGYYNPHNLNEYIILSDIENIIVRSMGLIATSMLDIVPEFEYIEKKYVYTSYKEYGDYDFSGTSNYYNKHKLGLEKKTTEIGTATATATTPAVPTTAIVKSTYITPDGSLTPSPPLPAPSAVDNFINDVIDYKGKTYDTADEEDCGVTMDDIYDFIIKSAIKIEMSEIDFLNSIVILGSGEEIYTQCDDYIYYVDDAENIYEFSVAYKFAVLLDGAYLWDYNYPAARKPSKQKSDDWYGCEDVEDNYGLAEQGLEDAEDNYELTAQSTLTEYSGEVEDIPVVDIKIYSYFCLTT